MTDEAYPRWTAHPGRALYDTRWRRMRAHARKAERGTSWIALAVGFVHGLAVAGLILAAVGVIALIAHAPQALTTWIAVAAVLTGAGLATAAIAGEARLRWGRGADRAART